MPCPYSCYLWDDYGVQGSIWRWKQRNTSACPGSLSPPGRGETRWQQVLSDWHKLLSQLFYMFFLRRCSPKPFTHCSNRSKWKIQQHQQSSSCSNPATVQDRASKTYPHLQIVKTTSIFVEEKDNFPIVFVLQLSKGFLLSRKGFFFLTDYYVGFFFNTLNC